MRRYEVIEYTHEDVEKLINKISTEEIIKILDNLEGGWLPKMPAVYYSETSVCDESDYDLVRVLVAIRKARMLLEQIKEAEPVDAVPVRHGQWIKKRYWSDGVGMGESYGYWYACSECDHEVKGGYGSCSDRFCSECGALMNGKVNNS